MFSPYENGECPARTLPRLYELSVGVFCVLSCLESFHVLKNLFLVKRIYERENYADDDIEYRGNESSDIVNTVINCLCLFCRALNVADKCKRPSTHCGCDCLSDLSREGADGVDGAVLTDAGSDLVVVDDVADERPDDEVEEAEAEGADDAQNDIQPKNLIKRDILWKF